MKNFLNKFENFLFDFLGLIIPGFIFSIVVVSPLSFLDIDRITKVDCNDTGLVNIFNLIHTNLRGVSETTLNVILSLILFYLIGHVVKVSSIILYEIFSEITEGLTMIIQWILGFLNINKLIKWLNQKFGSKILYKIVSNFFKLIKRTFNKLFSFKKYNYMDKSKPLYDYCLKKLKEENNEFPDDWYSLYKYSVILHSQEKIRSLSNFFLAKYNLYRSLAGISFLTLIYYVVLLTNIPSMNRMEGIISNYVLFAAIVFWFTFHIKFKRYWQLCGNEALISLYYYLTKNIPDD